MTVKTANKFHRTTAYCLWLVNHTLALCESVVRATKQVNGETQNLTPRHAQTP